jgi:hypothetical protein
MGDVVFVEGNTDTEAKCVEFDPGNKEKVQEKMDEIHINTPPEKAVEVEVQLTEKQKQRKALMPFVIISISYLLYTITDGSIRMIVLLHAYNKAFTAMEVNK